MSARGDELLQLLLELGPEQAARRVGEDPAALDELRELSLFVERCRGELAEPADARLVRAILARTTRQDPSWRGDLALVGRFVRDTLAGSALARAAAALLLVPLLGGTVLAWMVWRAARTPEGFLTGIEIQEVEPFLPAAQESPAESIEFPWLDDPFGDLGQSRPTVVVAVPGEARAAAARASAARALERAQWPLPTQDSALSAAFVRRARLWSEGLGSAPDGAVPHAETALAHALEVELLLDLWARDGRAPAALDAALAELGRDPHAHLDVRRLEALALDRARAYGRVDSEAWARLARSGARPGERAAEDPLDRHWRANLEAALAHSPAGRALLAQADVAAWLAQR